MGRLCENCECNSEIEVCADCDWRTKRYEIPKFATNGDVIKMLFPRSEVRKSIDDLVPYTLDGHVGNYATKDWWNAPYKSGD